MDKQEAYNYFWSQFGVPAYDETSVPDEETMKELSPTGEVYPYIIYQKIISSINEPVYPTASLFTRSNSWTEADSILNNIYDHLKNGGQIILIDNGRMWLVRGNPFAQPMSDPNDDKIRRYTINLAVEFFTE